jgi:hypothetical protein
MLIGPSAVGARLVEMTAGRHYHPIWTMSASVVLTAGGTLLLLVAVARCCCSLLLLVAVARCCCSFIFHPPQLRSSCMPPETG